MKREIEKNMTSSPEKKTKKAKADFFVVGNLCADTDYSAKMTFLDKLAKNVKNISPDQIDAVLFTGSFFQFHPCVLSLNQRQQLYVKLSILARLVNIVVYPNQFADFWRLIELENLKLLDTGSFYELNGTLIGALCPNHDLPNCSVYLGDASHLPMHNKSLVIDTTEKNLSSFECGRVNLCSPTAGFDRERGDCLYVRTPSHSQLTDYESHIGTENIVYSDQSIDLTWQYGNVNFSHGDQRLTHIFDGSWPARTDRTWTTVMVKPGQKLPIMAQVPDQWRVKYFK